MIHSRMSIRRAMALAYIVICTLFTSVGLRSGTSSWATQLLIADENSKACAGEAYVRLPLRFEMNVGQTDPQVKFISRGGDYSLFLTPTEAVLQLRMANRGLGNGELSESSSETTNPKSAVRMKFIGANSAPQVEGLEPFKGKNHYLIGKNPSQWHRDVTSYAKVRYRASLKFELTTAEMTSQLFEAHYPSALFDSLKSVSSKTVLRDKA